MQWSNYLIVCFQERFQKKQFETKHPVVVVVLGNFEKLLLFPFQLEKVAKFVKIAVGIS